MGARPVGSAVTWISRGEVPIEGFKCNQFTSSVVENDTPWMGESTLKVCGEVGAPWLAVENVNCFGDTAAPGAVANTTLTRWLNVSAMKRFPVASTATDAGEFSA